MNQLSSRERHSPTVSVVMPCFNALSTIEASIESVQKQSMTDWELLVVDDGSSDASCDLVRDMAGAHSRIRVVAQRNAGPAVARNRGVSLARGRIIAFLDADDLWEADHLEKHCRRLANDERLGISFSPSRFMDEAGTLTGEGTRILSRPLDIEDLLSGNPTGTCSALVVRRDVFDTAGLMRDDMIHAEDQEWLIRVLHAGWRIQCAPDAPIRYRISRTSLSSSIDKMLEGWQTVMEHAHARFPEAVDRQRSSALARMHLYFARRAVRSSGDRRSGFHHIATALAGNPGLPLRAPGNLLATIAVCALPNVTRHIRSAIAGGRHA